MQVRHASSIIAEQGIKLSDKIKKISNLITTNLYTQMLSVSVRDVPTIVASRPVIKQILDEPIVVQRKQYNLF